MQGKGVTEDMGGVRSPVSDILGDHIACTWSVIRATRPHVYVMPWKRYPHFFWFLLWNTCIYPWPVDFTHKGSVKRNFKSFVVSRNKLMNKHLVTGNLRHHKARGTCFNKTCVIHHPWGRIIEWVNKDCFVNVTQFCVEWKYPSFLDGVFVSLYQFSWLYIWVLR